jgi:hypothetical protein
MNPFALAQPPLAIAQSMQSLHQQARSEYQPIEECIVGSASRNVQWIEHTLDVRPSGK